MEGFNYTELWSLQEPQQRPHDIKAEELGIVDDIPVSPILTKLRDSIRRVEELYNANELLEEGIDIAGLLEKYPEAVVMEFLEANGYESAITYNEAESLVMQQEWNTILQIPVTKSDFFMLRQFEDSTDGKIDVSAFNTQDFLRTFDFEFDRYRYFTDKVAERAEDLAILHSCISGKEDREKVNESFEALVNGKYRNYALRLAEMLNTAKDADMKAELLEKLHEQNRQISRLYAIWAKHGYSR